MHIMFPDVLESYKELKNTGSENGLREFLTSFKRNADQVINVIYFNLEP